ncbi:MAG: chromate transporter [Clostridia bacterium]
MIFLQLFWDYFKIGLFTIGGGYAMIPLIRQEIVGVYISEELFLNMMAVAESTPGPFAINLATFVGMSACKEAYNSIFAGYMGALVATFGVVLPSFIIMLLVCVFIRKFSNSTLVKGYMSGVRPVVLGLICSAILTILASVVLPKLDFTNIVSSGFSQFNYVSLIIFCVFLGLSFIKVKKKRISPIILLIGSALVGIIVFGVFKVVQ